MLGRELADKARDQLIHAAGKLRILHRKTAREERRGACLVDHTISQVPADRHRRAAGCGERLDSGKPFLGPYLPQGIDSCATNRVLPLLVVELAILQLGDGFLQPL